MRLGSPLLAAFLAALVVAGCGGDDAKLIPAREAAQLTELVDEAGASSAAGECDAAKRNVAEARIVVRGLGRRTARELKQNLQAWLDHLEQEVGRECGRATDSEETATPDPTETATAEPTATETATPTATPTATATAEPTVTVDPGTGGGTAPEEPDGSGGVGPEEP